MRCNRWGERMKTRQQVCLGITLLLGGLACEPPAKVPSPASVPSAALVAQTAQPVVSASAASSAESVPAQPVASASAATPAYPPCPPEVPQPADALAWVSGCHILIREKILFDLEKSTIKQQSFSVIDAVGDVLVRNPDLRVEIEGHLGDPRREAYGRKLSDDRARSVMKYLIAKKGVPASQLSAKGFENDKPIADWRTDEGRAKNRRIEFVILGWGGQIR